MSKSKVKKVSEAVAMVDGYMDKAADLVERMVANGHATIDLDHQTLTMSLERFTDFVVEMAARAAEVYSTWRGKQTAEAVKALRIYGAHKPLCRRSAILSCDCGLDAALEAVKKLSTH